MRYVSIHYHCNRNKPQLRLPLNIQTRKCSLCIQQHGNFFSGKAASSFFIPLFSVKVYENLTLL